MNTKIKKINIAKGESFKSGYKHKIGCSIFNGSTFLSKGYNRIRYAKDYIKFTNYVESLHAERDAIRKVKNKVSLVGASIFVYREYANGHPAISLPCDDCMELIRSVGIKKIYYTIDEYPFYKVEKL